MIFIHNTHHAHPEKENVNKPHYDHIETVTSATTDLAYSKYFGETTGMMVLIQIQGSVYLIPLPNDGASCMMFGTKAIQVMNISTVECYEFSEITTKQE